MHRWDSLPLTPMDVGKTAELDSAMNMSGSHENVSISRMADVANVADASEGGTVQNDAEIGSVYIGKGDEQHVKDTVKLVRAPNDRNIKRMEASQYFSTAP